MRSVYKKAFRVSFLKTQEHQQTGEYKPTSVDEEKKEVDFRIVQVGPYFINWKDGRRERVTEKRLKNLQSKFTWTTDF